jgi:hypothetical protein
MFLNAFGQPVVVLQSFKAAFELLQVNKCADISSDRPRYIFVLRYCSLFTAPVIYGDLPIPSFLRKSLG